MTHYPSSDFSIVVDVETTGFDKIGCDVIHLAAVLIDKNLEIKAKFSEKIAPQSKKYWSMDAEKIHGFTFEQASLFRNPRDVCRDFLWWILPFKHSENRPLKFIYHANGYFDYQFTEWLFRKQEMQYSFWKCFNSRECVSTIKMAKEAGYKENSLDMWAQRVGFKLNHHNAESDSLCCYEVYKFLKEKHGYTEGTGTFSLV